MTTEAENTCPLFEVSQTDWFLQSLVNIAHDVNLEIGITLQVSGMLVSGNLVSGKQYFEGFATDFASAFIAHPEVAESIKNSFASYGDIYNKEAEVESSQPQPLPQYIHLKNARFFNTAGNPIPGNRGVWWRGRICEVGGFTLGSLSPETA